MRAWSTAQGAWSMGLGAWSTAQGAWGQSLLAVVLMLVMACGAFGQTADDLGEGLRAELTSTSGVTAIKWWGKAGRTYFVQSSDSLLPDSWQYMPVVEAGADAVCTWNLQTSASKMFVRLVYTDQAYTGSAADADFDGDGLSNALEVSSAIRSNPFLADTDADGFSDGVEHQYGYSPTLASSTPETASGTRYLEVASAWFNAWHVVSQPQQGVQVWLRMKRYSGLPGYTTRPDELLSEKPPFPPLPPLPDFDSLSYGSWSTLFENPVASGEHSRFDQSSVEDEDYAYQWSKARIRAAAPSLRDRHYWLLLEHGSPGMTPSGREFRHVVLPAGTVQGAEVQIKQQQVNQTQKQIREGGLLEWDVEGRGQHGDFVDSPFVDGDAHFVAPRWAQDIDGNSNKTIAVVAKGVGSPQLQPGGSSQTMEWSWSPVAAASLDPANYTRLLVNREHARKVTITITPKQANTGTTARLNVWVVWCDMAAIMVGNSVIRSTKLPFSPLPLGDYSGRQAGKWFAGVGIEWTATVKPEEIITDEDRPELDKQTLVPPPGGKIGVPGGGSNDNSNNGFSGWDMSRQRRTRAFKGTNLVPVQANDPDDSTGITFPVDYPTKPMEGNDDANPKEEDDFPYPDDDELSQPRGLLGELVSTDTPLLEVLDPNKAPAGPAGTGFDGDKLIVRHNFREFARLQIGAKWYRVSDFGTWRHHYQLKRESGQWMLETGTQSVFDLSSNLTTP